MDLWIRPPHRIKPQERLNVPRDYVDRRSLWSPRVAVTCRGRARRSASRALPEPLGVHLHRRGDCGRTVLAWTCSRPWAAWRSACQPARRILIWVMIIPMLVRVDFTALQRCSSHVRGIGVTLFINWLVKPFSMALWHGSSSVTLRALAARGPDRQLHRRTDPTGGCAVHGHGLRLVGSRTATRYSRCPKSR